MTDLIVYDVEGTDIHVRHSQITQFAAVRANDAFEVTDETDIRIRRLPYVVPAPEALRVTGMDPFDLDREDLPTEFEASVMIERSFFAPMGRSQLLVTFNGPNYDDELIRTTLFRNLRSPWFNTGAKNGRVDMLAVIRLADAGDPGAITIPADAEGKPSWRLEKVCPVNGIGINAHDALGDVRATLALAELVSRKASWAWDIAKRCAFADKTESLLSDCARTGRPAWLFTHFGKPDVVPCAVHGTDGKKRWILSDLRRDDVPGDPSTISQGLYSRESPFRVVRSNGIPLLLTEQEALRLRPDLDAGNLVRSCGVIKQEGTISAAATQALRDSTFDAPEEQTSEERIYGGFAPREDNYRMTTFNAAKSWEERAAVRFSDARLRDFAGRIVTEAIMTGRGEVSEELARRSAADCAVTMARPHGPADSRWMTLAAAREKGADERWEDWASTAFTDEPSVDQYAEPGVQIGFGF